MATPQEMLIEVMKNAGILPSDPAVRDVSVVNEGTQIILPVVNGKPMTPKEAIKWLERKAKEDDTVVRVHHEFICSPLDGAVAFHRAIAKIYGWSQNVPTPGFWGSTPPTMVGVPISPTETMQIPWGRIQIPGIEGHLQTALDSEPVPRFILAGEVKQKHKKEVQELADETKKFLNTQSIYKGKAIKVSFEWQREGENFDPMQHCPKFFPIDGVKEGDLIFSKEIQKALEIGLFTPIEQAEACRRYKVPLKRGILLHGVYGCGKSLTAAVAAIKAVRNGFTFVYLDSSLDLQKGLQFAANYAPAVVFCEDIDRATEGERSVALDELLNILDGVDTKGAEILTVFTTNHVDKINPALLRMGRLDTLIHVTPPDENAVERLVRLYGRGLLAPEVNLTKIGESLKGNIPAFVREVVERAKIAAIQRTNGGDIVGKVLEEDLLSAATAMEAHAKMLNPSEQVALPKAEVFVKVSTAKGHGRALLQKVGFSNGEICQEDLAD